MPQERREKGGKKELALVLIFDMAEGRRERRRQRRHSYGKTIKKRKKGEVPVLPVKLQPNRKKKGKKDQLSYIPLAGKVKEGRGEGDVNYLPLPPLPKKREKGKGVS